MIGLRIAEQQFERPVLMSFALVADQADVLDACVAGRPQPRK